MIRVVLALTLLLSLASPLSACENCDAAKVAAILEKIDELRELFVDLVTPPVDPEDPEDPPVDPEDPEDPPVDPEDPDDPVDPEDPPVIPPDHHNDGKYHLEHMPDFSLDPQALVLEPGTTLELSEQLSITTLVVKFGATLVLNPGAEIVFRDVPIDRELDKDAIGNGLIVMGDLQINGTPRTAFTRAAGSIAAGDEVLSLTQAVHNWQVGDTLAIAGTRQRLRSEPYITETERVTITSVNNDGTIGITPTVFAHAAGPVEGMTAHVANLTRDIVLRSENPSGVRGHCMMMGACRTTWAYCELRDLGRTDAMRMIDPVSNPNARYPWHTHLIKDHGINQRAEGVVANGSKKWCFTIHGTNEATLLDCIAIGAVGGAFVTENGTERRNTITNCLAMNARNGTNIGGDVVELANGAQDFAREGSGFWGRGMGNHFTNCVSADTEFGGFRFHGKDNTKFYQPYPAEGQTGTFKNNECYSTREAIWLREHLSGWTSHQSGWKRVFIEDSTAWNITLYGSHVYRTAQVTVRNCHFYTDPEIQKLNNGGVVNANNSVGGWSVGIHHSAGYPVGNAIYEDCTSTGFNYGTHLPPAQPILAPGSSFHMRNCHLIAGVPIVVPRVKNQGQYHLTDVTWEQIPMLSHAAQPSDTDIWMKQEGSTFEWPMPPLYYVWINGERYFYAAHPAANRVERERLIGLVIPKP